MGDSAALKQIVAEMFGAPVEAVDASFPLRHPRLNGSAARAALAAAIKKKLGVYCARAVTAARYGELEAAILGTAVPNAGPPAELAPAGAAAPASRPTAGTSPAAGVPGVRLGVDAEMVESMPDVPDFWAAPFYQAHFTPAEIAYCVRQEQPRMHFAARWCAKEALAKCEPRFAAIDPATVQVASLPDGQPVLEVVDAAGSRRIDCAVSLSHTPLMAFAVVASVVRSEGALP